MFYVYFGTELSMSILITYSNIHFTTPRIANYDPSGYTGYGSSTRFMKRDPWFYS